MQMFVAALIYFDFVSAANILTFPSSLSLLKIARDRVQREKNKNRHLSVLTVLQTGKQQNSLML